MGREPRDSDCKPESGSGKFTKIGVQGKHSYEKKTKGNAVMFSVYYDIGGRDV